MMLTHFFLLESGSSKRFLSFPRRSLIFSRLRNPTFNRVLFQHLENPKGLYSVGMEATRMLEGNHVPDLMTWRSGCLCSSECISVCKDDRSSMLFYLRLCGCLPRGLAILLDLRFSRSQLGHRCGWWGVQLGFWYEVPHGGWRRLKQLCSGRRSPSQ